VGVRCWLSQRPPDVRRNAVAAELTWFPLSGAKTAVHEGAWRAIAPLRHSIHTPMRRGVHRVAWPQPRKGMLAERTGGAHPCMIHCIRPGTARWVAHGECIASPRVHVVTMSGSLDRTPLSLHMAGSTWRPHARRRLRLVTAGMIAAVAAVCVVYQRFADHRSFVRYATHPQA